MRVTRGPFYIWRMARRKSQTGRAGGVSLLDGVGKFNPETTKGRPKATQSIIIRGGMI
jgi:hypothetical protein